MENKIFQLLYLSSSSYLMNQEELLDILKKSRENNQYAGITGFMLYSEGNIIQLLEGQRDAVESLFSKISKDKRHFGVYCMLKEYSEKRDFPDWSMGFEHIEISKLEKEVDGVNKLLCRQNISQEYEKHISQKVRIFLESFRLMSRKSV
ncbi:MAG: BLUF domain-containing protein [Bacteroidota bacterium]